MFVPMSLPEQIENWLVDGYYAGGVAILRRSPGVSFHRLRFFEQYLGAPFVPSAVERDLRSVMEGLAGAVGEEEVAETPAVSTSETTETKAETFETPLVKQDGRVRIGGKVSGTFWGPFFADLTDVPVEVWMLYKRAIVLHKRQSENHALLRQAAESGDRKRALDLATERMEDIEPALDGIYDAARTWKEKGILPAPEERSTAAADAVAKLKREKYLRERRSRLNAWLEKGEHPRKKNGVRSWVKMTLEEAEGYRRELEEIENELRMEN